MAWPERTTQCLCESTAQPGAVTGASSSSRLQVCQFVVSVNGLNVLHVDYRTVSNLILTGPRTIVMEVMEELECWAGRAPGGPAEELRRNNTSSAVARLACPWVALDIQIFSPCTHTLTRVSCTVRMGKDWVMPLKNNNLCQCRTYLRDRIFLLGRIALCSSHPLFFLFVCRNCCNVSPAKTATC